MLLGQQIGPFEIDKELGSGAMGTVYRARFTKDDKVIPVALKVVSMGLLGNESAMSRFEREANILKQLRHPHIVRLIATGRFRGTPFIAMEYIDGEPLDRPLARRGRFSWEEVCRLGRQLCGALQYAHEKGIIHRDLKPANLMFTRDGTLKLTDFGIAKDVDVTALTGANSTIGTAAYMSPEQCKGDRNLTPKSDLYSLGIVFYELLTGRKPFVSENTVDMFLKHVHEPVVRPARLVPDLPVWLDNLVCQLVEKEKDDRPADAATVARMLADIEEKVQAQQSAGEAVANARRIDRVASAPLDEADKEAARALKGKGRGKKKRKKKGPDVAWFERGWVKGVGIAATLLLLVGMLVMFVRPAGAGAMYATFEAAPDGEPKVAAAERYLKSYGDQPDARTAAAAAVYREAKVKERERQLANRFGRELKNPEPHDDPDAYQAAWEGLLAERDGNLKLAGDLWAKVRDRFPNEGRLPYAADEDTLNKARWAWVAEKRLKDLKAAGELPQKLREQIRDDRLAEVQRATDPTAPEGRAVRALRLEEFGDPAKARAVWDGLASVTEKDAATRVWYLLACQQRGQLGKPNDDEARAKRIALVGRKAAELQKLWEQVAADPEQRVGQRKARNDARDIVDLYDDESADALKQAVAQARKLLDAMTGKKAG